MMNDYWTDLLITTGTGLLLAGLWLIGGWPIVLAAGGGMLLAAGLVRGTLRRRARGG